MFYSTGTSKNREISFLSGKLFPVANNKSDGIAFINNNLASINTYKLGEIAADAERQVPLIEKKIKSLQPYISIVQQKVSKIIF